ncbi:MAG TPA: hypothetical protein PLK94_14635 [Alphaproteobacteria bacterium]|nr:hypothetical protein [Alphaproteobacteria bacterium]
MSRIIKSFYDGSYLEYDRGSFDDWCVYLTQPSGTRKPPRDIDYFSELQSYASTYGVDRIYSDYVSIYDSTGKEVEEQVFDQINTIAQGYGKDSLEIEKVFSILYMAMIAEEQKRFTRLGKRIKRLGIYKLLFENMTPYEAANFMKGMGWRDISQLCSEQGF